ncbi:hypothetical protein A2U01_0062503, partial [Trifolium medium]|nr:hypothetical protein [Trifolium medium]
DTSAPSRLVSHPSLSEHALTANRRFQAFYRSASSPDSSALAQRELSEDALILIFLKSYQLCK